MIVKIVLIALSTFIAWVAIGVGMEEYGVTSYPAYMAAGYVLGIGYSLAVIHLGD